MSNQFCAGILTGAGLMIMAKGIIGAVRLWKGRDRCQLSDFEALTLATVRAQDRYITSVGIRAALCAVTGRDISVGGLFTALDCLERWGLVCYHVAPGDASRGLGPDGTPRPRRFDYVPCADDDNQNDKNRAKCGGRTNH